MFLRRPTALLAFAMIVLSLAAALSPSSARAADGRYALVIGNGNYATVPDLPNARTDAQHVGAKLAGIGFDVTLGLDLDATGFSNAVADFRAKLKTGNARNVVFYYSGHGFALKGYNFLVPVDATLNDRDSIGRETLALDRIISAIRTSPVQETAIFLDACRNNPFHPG